MTFDIYWEVGVEMKSGEWPYYFINDMFAMTGDDRMRRGQRYLTWIQLLKASILRWTHSAHPDQFSVRHGYDVLI